VRLHSAKRAPEAVNLLRRARFAIRATRLDASLVLHVHSMPAIEAVAHVVQTIPKQAASTVQDLYQLESLSGGLFKADLLSNRGWREAQDQLLLNVANRLVAKSQPDSVPVTDVASVDSHCPGLASAIRSIHSALRDSIGPKPRMLQESDFVDAVHAMYAPYVSVFRADRYMSVHVQRSVDRYHTTVVSSLLELPERISRAISQHGDG
jgi:hypothetical protein